MNRLQESKRKSARVRYLILSGKSLPEAAKVVGISPRTARDSLARDYPNEQLTRDRYAEQRRVLDSLVDLLASGKTLTQAADSLNLTLSQARGRLRGTIV